MANINIADGRKKFTVNGDENRAFYTNLTDDEIGYRAEQAPKRIAAYADELSAKVESGEVSELEARHIISEKAKEEIDNVFDADVSSVVFGRISVFAEGDPKTHETLFELFWKSMFPHLKKEIKNAQKHLAESEKRIAKYTAKYTNKYRK